MIAEVVIDSKVKKLNRTFDYQVPVHLEEKIQIGSRVLIPFGNKKELTEGFVLGFKEKTSFALKEIASIEGHKFLEPDSMELAHWMEKRYFCNLSDCIKLMLPPGMTTKQIR